MGLEISDLVHEMRTEHNRPFSELSHVQEKDFDTLNKDDSGLPIGERKGSTLLLAIRDWDYERLFGTQRNL